MYYNKHARGVNMVHAVQPKGKLVVFSGPSGTGKTTLVKHLLQCGLGLEFSVSATNRPPRSNETDQKDYYFLSEKEFREKMNNQEFLEWEEVYPGILYGTLKKEVERIRENGGNAIFDVDVAGGLKIKKFYGQEALAVFIMPPSLEELKKRLTNRSTETEEKINNRLAKAKYEMTFAKQFDQVLINNNLKEAFIKAEKLIRNFLQ